MPYKAEMDWDAIKLEFVQGYEENGQIIYPSLVMLSKKYEINISMINRHSADENWTDSREIYQRTLERKIMEGRIKELSKQALAFDIDVLKVATLAVKHIQGHFKSAEQRFIASGGTDPMPANKLFQLSNALDKYQKVGRLALGRPTGIEGGESSDEDRNTIIEAILGDPAFTDTIADNYRRRIGKSTGQK